MNRYVQRVARSSRRGLAGNTGIKSGFVQVEVVLQRLIELEELLRSQRADLSPDDPVTVNGCDLVREGSTVLGQPTLARNEEQSRR